MKKIITILLILSFLLLWSSLYGEDTKAVFEQPFLITSVGQSAEVQIALVLAKKAGLTYSLNKTATPDDFKGAKTLVLVLGASLKGLGSAGLNMTKEKERVNILVEEAEKRGMQIFCLHLGGESRRGSLSDGLIKEYLPFATLALVVKSGNNDGLFTTICREHNIPLVEIERAAQAVEPFKNAFK